MSYNLITFEASEDGVALVTVNRPEKLNALNAAVMGELDDAFRRVEGDPAVRGLILTGAGDKAFVAGADIGELPVGHALAAREMSLRGQAVLGRLERMGKPSIAAINGYALGGGLELALCCTMRIASENAKLALPEIKLGIMPGYGGTQRLSRLVGRGHALEMLLTGGLIDAAEAGRIGLVNHVVLQTELLNFSRALLRGIFENAPLAVASILETVDTGLNTGLDEGLRFEAAVFATLAASEDAAEGTRAFLEKRKPVFKGK
ncbi:MAG TPA: enoyl-CoA hydratase-related protein [Bryobacteraceae bacterium]|nr:enoyl-CoA hydratase-related protein [Bryobacteraceae bacterium]